MPTVVTAEVAVAIAIVGAPTLTAAGVALMAATTTGVMAIAVATVTGDS